MNTLLQDVRFGFRMLAKNPGFTAVAVITLALGIGANSTIFSWINSTLLNPIPGVADTSNLVSVMRGEWSENPTPPFSYPDYVDLRARTQSFSGLMAYHEDYMSLTGTDKPERIYGAFVSANYFDVLGVRAHPRPRLLLPEEEKPGGTPAVVISYALWRTPFGADRSVIGKSIQIDRRLCTIVGVAPPGFQGCKTGTAFGPLGSPWFMATISSAERGTFWLNVLGRLKPGVTPAQAEEELNVQMQRIVEQYPDSHRGPNQITLDPLYRSPFGANVYLYKTLPMLLALAAVLLLLACANVANLLLVRSVTRRREVALRLSMGATPLAAGAPTPGGKPAAGAAGRRGRHAAYHLDGRDFCRLLSPHSTFRSRSMAALTTWCSAVTMVISILTALVFGILPALRTSSLAPIAVLKEEAGSMSGGIHKSRLSRALVVAQISLSLLLLICAGLFIRSLQNAQRLDPGFDPNHVLVASYELGPVGYSQDQGIAFHRQLLSKLSALPGVESVTLADFSPLSFTIHTELCPSRWLPATNPANPWKSAAPS